MRPHSPLHLVITATLAALSGCASQWTQVSTKHFNFYTETVFSHEATLKQLEYSYAGLSSSFFRGKDIGRVDVLMIFDGFSDYLGTVRPGAYVSKLPGAAKGENGLIVLRPDALASAQAMLTHAFIDKVIPNAPLWFHAGFASWAGLMQYRAEDTRAVICFGQIGAPNNIMPTDKLFVSSWNQYNDEYRGWFPYTGRMFVDWILWADDGARRHQLGPLVQGLSEGKGAQELVPQIFGIQLDELDKQLSLFMEKVQHADPRGLCPIGFPIQAGKEPDKGPWQTTDLPDGALDTTLAALKKLPGREGYPAFFPADVVDQAFASKKK